MKAIKEFIRLNKKMFYVMCAIVGSFFLILIILFIVKLVKGNKISYSKLQDKMVAAAQNYYSDNQDNLPKNEGDKISISTDALVSGGYLKSLDKLVGSSCSGNVTVRKNGEDYMYYPFVDCGSDYKTKTLGSIVTDESNIVTSGDGLYKTDDGYVFRGEFVNNYVSFAGSIWRIISIDNEDIIRMIKQEYLDDDYFWDDRYNVNTEEGSGINDYQKSRMYDSLNDLYNKSSLFDENSKKHLVLYDVCIGKRNSNFESISKSADCSSTVKAYIGLPTIYDILNPSLDTNCKKISDKSCSNYNYFTNFLYYTWLSNATLDNSYEVYSGSPNAVTLISAEEYLSINPVIALYFNDIYTSGDGTLDNPYVVYKH